MPEAAHGLFRYVIVRPQRPLDLVVDTLHPRLTAQALDQADQQLLGARILGGGVAERRVSLELARSEPLVATGRHRARPAFVAMSYSGGFGDSGMPCGSSTPFGNPPPTHERTRPCLLHVRYPPR